MIDSMKEYIKNNPNFEIIPADHPIDGLVGYVAWDDPYAMWIVAIAHCDGNNFIFRKGSDFIGSENSDIGEYFKTPEFRKELVRKIKEEALS